MGRIGSTFVALALVGACAHDKDQARPTAITSGTPSGVRVTGAAAEERAPELRLSDEICRREEACNRIGRSARYPSLESCLSDQASRMRRELSAWECSPAASRARFEECLASIRSERCETLVDRPGRLPACRSNVVCSGP